MYIIILYTFIYILLLGTLLVVPFRSVVLCLHWSYLLWRTQAAQTEWTFWSVSLRYTHGSKGGKYRCQMRLYAVTNAALWGWNKRASRSLQDPDPSQRAKGTGVANSNAQWQIWSAFHAYYTPNNCSYLQHLPRHRPLARVIQLMVSLELPYWKHHKERQEQWTSCACWPLRTLLKALLPMGGACPDTQRAALNKIVIVRTNEN